MKKIDYGAMFTLRKDGRYCASYTDERGKRHFIYDKDPKRLYEKVNAPVEEVPVTFAEIAQAWRDEHYEKIEKGTQTCYEPSRKRAVELFGDEIASEIRPSEIQAHLKRLKEQGYGSKTIKTQRTVYHLIFAHAMMDDRYGKTVRSDPSSGCTIPKGAKKPVKRTAPPTDVIDKIRKSADEAYFGLFPLLLISTGLRRGEALALRWRDIDIEAKTISVTRSLHYDGTAWIGQTKTENSVRTVPILPDLLPHLQKAYKKGAEPDHFIFHASDPEKPMPENAYKRRWTRWCKEMGFVTEAGKPSITAHVMRHSYATMLYDAGVDLYTAQKLLGHADIQTTMSIYTHLRQEKEKSSISMLEKFVQTQM